MKLSNNKRRQLTQLVDKAMQQLRAGQKASAEQTCNQADRIVKDHAEILNVRGLIAGVDGNIELAIKWFSAASSASPKQAEFQANLAGCLALCDREEEALAIYPEVLQRLPRQSEASLGYATALAAVGEYRLAVKALETGLSHNPKHIRMLQKLTDILNDLGETARAIEITEKARRLAPDSIDLLFDTAVYHLGQGMIEEGRELLRKVIERNPRHINALSLLRNSGMDDKTDSLASIKAIYEQSAPDSGARITAAYALGNEAEEHGDFQHAFELWQEANSQRRKSISYQPASVEAAHAAIIKAFPASRFADEPDTPASDVAPIFIVGMPRCGSTLLERALTRHPALSTIGEIDVIEQALIGRNCKVRGQEALEKMIAADHSILREVGFETERRLKEEHGIAGRAVCKALNYYMYAGLIAAAMPKARIIHLKRNPMATCLSIFKEDFGASQPYAYDLEEMGRRYQMYSTLVKHWRKALPEQTMLDASYENLVSDPEAELRRILDFCNLDWNPACLATHEAEGSVATASIIQVRQPIHQKSVARWKQFEKQLAPLKKLISD